MSAEQRSARQHGQNNQKIDKTFHRFASVSTLSLYFPCRVAGTHGTNLCFTKTCHSVQVRPKLFHFC
jgi:hypothetical protein